MFGVGSGSLVIYNFMFPHHQQDDRPAPHPGIDGAAEAGGRPRACAQALLDQLDDAADGFKANGKVGRSVQLDPDYRPS